MPYLNEHAARIINMNEFEQNSFRRKNIASGIDIIIGKLKGKTTTTTQAYRFDAKKFTADQAKKWLKDNKIKYISFEPAKKSTNSEINMEQISNKPLLLYMPIYDSVAEQFVEKMNDIENSEDIEIWLNSPGGRVFAGWSIIGPMQKREGNIKTCVFGNASSMAVYIPLYSDYSEALEVTKFTLHRADMKVENEEDQKYLDSINKDLRKQMESKLDLEMFTQITGKTMDDLFNPKTRLDITLSAKEAKKVGLINNILKLDQKQIKAYSEKFVAFADFDFEQRSSEESQRSVISDDILIINNNNKKNMTKSELKSQHPELYAEIYEEGLAAGVKQEATRVKSWIAYLGIDKENVITSIKEAKEFTPDVMAEMSVKLASKARVEDIEGDSKEKTPTDQPDDKTAEQKEIETVEKLVTDHFKTK